LESSKVLQQPFYNLYRKRHVLADPDQSPLSAVPEKVQVQGTSRGALEFNYDSVLPGSGNRQAFISALLEFQGSLLIFTGGRWYDVR
jgi:hypothetical protein